MRAMALIFSPAWRWSFKKTFKYIWLSAQKYIFHWREIKSQNLPQDSTQNVEISTYEAVTFDLI